MNSLKDKMEDEMYCLAFIPELIGAEYVSSVRAVLTKPVRGFVLFYSKVNPRLLFCESPDFQGVKHLQHLLRRKII